MKKNLFEICLNYDKYKIHRIQTKVRFILLSLLFCDLRNQYFKAIEILKNHWMYFPNCLLFLIIIS